MPRPGPRVQEKSKNFKGSITRLIGNLKPWKYFMIFALVLAMISSILSLVAPNKLSDLTDTITAGISLKEEKLEEIGTKIGDNFSEEKLQNKMKSLYINVELTKEELSDVNKIFEQLKDVEEKEQLLLQLPDKVLIYLLDDIEIDGVVITEEEQLKTLRLTSNLNENSSKEESLAIIEELPESVYKLIKPSIDMEKIASIAIFMATLYVISALFSYIQGFSMSTVSNRFANELRKKISTKINKLPLKYYLVLLMT